MREGAKEALRQVQQRFAPLTTDEERRRWGLAYKQCLPTYHSVLATATRYILLLPLVGSAFIKGGDRNCVEHLL